MGNANDDDNVVAAPVVAAGMDTSSNCVITAPAAVVDDTIASSIRRHGASRPVLPDTTFAFDFPRGVLHTRIPYCAGLCHIH
eukprot:5927478-Pleurochrysis_carterae.AAC.2